MSEPRITFSSQVAASAAVSDTLNTQIASVDLSKLRHFALVVKNTGAVNLNAFTLEGSPDGSIWYTVDATTLATLAASAVGKIGVANNGGRYYRGRASVAAGTSQLDAWFLGGN